MHIKKLTSGLFLIISQASLRHSSASSMKKSEVKQVATSVSAGILYSPFRDFFKGKLKLVMFLVTILESLSLLLSKK